MNKQGLTLSVLGFHDERTLVLDVSDARRSSDGGLMVIRAFDERIGLTARIAAARKPSVQAVGDRVPRREAVAASARPTQGGRVPLESQRKGLDAPGRRKG